MPLLHQQSNTCRLPQYFAASKDIWPKDELFSDMYNILESAFAQVQFLKLSFETG